MEQHGMTSTPLNPPDPGSAGVGSLVMAEPHLILLVEDDFMLRGSLAAVLQSEGYRVESAANALEALDRLTRPPKPSLILLDIMLPYMDGLEFRALQRAAPDMADIPVIVITAVGLQPEVAVELDLRQTFFKPLERPRLLDAIRRHCAPRTG
jgi:two-component system, chemotaxis family, chemotaxis protein CheY